MKRWHLGCLLVLVLGLTGCEAVPIPDCYLPALSLADPAELPGFASALDGSALSLTNTSAPTTTFVLRSGFYLLPPTIVLDNARNSILRIEPANIQVVRATPVPVYPNCDQKPGDLSVPLPVIQHGERRELNIRITYAYNTSGVEAYEGFVEAAEARGQRMTILLGIGIVILTIVGIGAVYLIVTLISALATLVSKE
jgi:hypothetical protein